MNCMITNTFCKRKSCLVWLQEMQIRLLQIGVGSLLFALYCVYVSLVLFTKTHDILLGSNWKRLCALCHEFSIFYIVETKDSSFCELSRVCSSG